MFVRSAFNYDRGAVSEETGLSCGDVMLTQQQFKEETDINTLVKRFGIGGQLPEDVRMPTYADFGEVYDFHSAANAIAAAREAFDAMPADVRWKFRNDPAEFVAFCSNKDNLDEARKLGLAPAAVPLNTAPAVSSEPVSASGAAPSPSAAPVGGEGA